MTAGHAPDPTDPATVTGTREEQLAVFEAAIERAGDTLRSSRARFVVETGTALRAIRDRELWLGRYGSFREYVKQRWEMDRTRAYQLIDAAPAMLTMSRIGGVEPVESHTKVVGPILEQHGETAVREVFAAARVTGEKITAQALSDHAARLHYVSAPVHAGDDTGQTPGEARDIVLLEQGLAALRAAHRALRGRVVSNAVAADYARAGEMLDEMTKLAGQIVKLAE